MNWEGIKALEINEQVKIMNELVKEHGSITKVTKIIGVSEKPIRNHFGNNGFKFDKELKKYIQDTNTRQDTNTSLEEPVREHKCDSTTNIKGLEVKTDNMLVNMLELEQKISAMVEQEVKLQLEKHFANNKQQIIKDGIELDELCQGEVKYRSYGVYKSISDMFDEYASKHPRLSKVELVSQAILLFINQNE